MPRCLWGRSVLEKCSSEQGGAQGDCMEKSPCQSVLGPDLEWLVDMIFTPTIFLMVWIMLCTFARWVPVSFGVQKSAGPKH